MEAAATPPMEILENEEEEEEDERGYLYEKRVLLSNVKAIRRSDSVESFGSMTSMYSASAGKGDYAITGQIQVGIWYKDGQLFVRVGKANGLAVAKKAGYSDPYVKTYLLPDRSKHGKRKTGIQRKTVNPVFNESLKYKVEQVELKLRTLWLSVWDWDRFGRNFFLGEVHLPLSSLDLTDPHDRWHDLLEKEFSQQDPYCGQLSVGLMFSPKKTVQTTLGTQTKGHLHILIKQAKELPIRDAHGLTDATVKCYLLPNRKSSGKKKTQVIKNSLNPVWEEQFTYQVTREELSKDRVLEITVWDYDRRGTNDFIGGLRLGPARAKGKNKEWMDCTGDELSHWEDMLERPGEWVELWHTLRPSLEHSKYPSTADGFSPVLKALSDPATPPITGEDETPVSKLPETYSVSFESTVSVSSEAGEKGDYDICGEVLMAVYYKDGILVIHVNRARGLTAADSNSRSDPFIKTYLLPDRSQYSKRKSAVRKNTLDPVYDEKLKYKVSKSELDSRTLWLSVWDWDRFGRNQFLGEVHLPLSSIDLRDTSQHWHVLQDKEGSAQCGTKTRSHGKVRLGLMYMPNEKKGQKGTLTIMVRQAKDLPPMDAAGLANTGFKCCLLPDRSSRGKRKTGVIKSNLNPAWEEQFTYDVSHEELARERVLEASVWEYDEQGNRFIGGLRLGPRPSRNGRKQKEWMDCTGDELSHWEEMLAHPGEWVELWHTLRLTLDPRPVHH